jgi:hypothetical protein
MEHHREFSDVMRHTTVKRKMKAAKTVSVSRKEKELYLRLLGWTTEKTREDVWWFPPAGSPILTKYSMTRSLDHAFDWQKNVDGN